MTTQSITPSEQLVPVFQGQIGDQNVQLCDARALHVYLGNGDRFASWIVARIQKYQFVENQDFLIVSVITETIDKNGKARGSKRTDYHITLDMAKELAMVENNSKGREVRRYFIQVEKLMLESMAAQPSFANVAAVVRDWADTARSLAATASSQANIAQTLAEECERRIGLVMPSLPHSQPMLSPKPPATVLPTEHSASATVIQFLTGMWDCLGSRHVTAGDLYRIITSRQCLALTDAAVALFGDLEQWTAKRLATMLRKWSEQPVLGFAVAAVNRSKHGIVWRLERIS